MTSRVFRVEPAQKIINPLFTNRRGWTGGSAERSQLVHSARGNAFHERFSEDRRSIRGVAAAQRFAWRLHDIRHQRVTDGCARRGPETDVARLFAGGRNAGRSQDACVDGRRANEAQERPGRRARSPGSGGQGAELSHLSRDSRASAPAGRALESYCLTIPVIRAPP